MAAFDLTRKDTIAALATAPQPAAIALVRVSGDDAERIRDRVFRPHRGRPPRPFVATLGHVLDASAAEGPPIDEALCTFFPAGRSYTGEATFELSLHGGPSRTASTLRSLVAAGCRLAEPGEMTLRAVLTGRMDVTQAEAVHQLVSARSDEAARVALQNLAGGLSAQLHPLRGSVIDALAELEARLDYPDEELGESATSTLIAQLDESVRTLDRLLGGAVLGRRLLEGARVVLFGAPNAGKSTLLNALVGEERALVHESPGTTRDVLEAETTVQGIPTILVDVAGIREEAGIHPVEAMGIARARAELLRADLVLYVVELPPGEDLASHLAALDIPPHEAPALTVLTKSDLAPLALPAPAGSLRVSARTGAGVADLREGIARSLGVSGGVRGDEALLAGQRQRLEVEAARASLVEAARSLRAGEVHEVVASELRSAGRAIDRLLGTRLDDDVLNVVFSRFCIGK